MQSTILISQNKKYIESEIEKIKKKESVSDFNLHLINPDSSLVIEHVRQIKNILREKPFGEGNRLVIITDIDNSTIEAGNALLKILEEPPSSTIILLTAQNSDRILPTIASRCLILEEKKGSVEDSKDLEKTRVFLKDILNLSAGERMVYWTKQVKNKDEAVTLLLRLLIFLSAENLDNEKEKLLPVGESAHLIRKIMSAQRYLERNVNFKAALDILFIGFPNPE